MCGLYGTAEAVPLRRLIDGAVTAVPLVRLIDGAVSAVPLRNRILETSSCIPFRTGDVGDAAQIHAVAQAVKPDPRHQQAEDPPQHVHRAAPAAWRSSILMGGANRLP